MCFAFAEWSQYKKMKLWIITIISLESIDLIFIIIHLVFIVKREQVGFICHGLKCRPGYLCAVGSSVVEAY